jgi:hypothetical protein
MKFLNQLHVIDKFNLNFGVPLGVQRPYTCLNAEIGFFGDFCSFMMSLGRVGDKHGSILTSWESLSMGMRRLGFCRVSGGEI